MWSNKQVRIDKEAVKKKANKGLLCNNSHKYIYNNVEM